MWDCVFGTRKAGNRAEKCLQKTRRDVAEINESKTKVVRKKTMWDDPQFSLVPVLFVAVLVGLKLFSRGLGNCCYVA